MFKKSTGLLLSLLLVAGSAVAELKIAVIDTQRALLESDEAKQLMQAAQADLEGDQKQLQQLSQEIQTLREAYRKDSEIMSDAERKTRGKAIEEKQMEAEFLANKLQKAIQDRRQELGEQLVPKLQAVLNDLTGKENYDLILERGAVLYMDPKHDITERVTGMLNEKRSSGG